MRVRVFVRRRSRGFSANLLLVRNNVFACITNLTLEDPFVDKYLCHIVDDEFDLCYICISSYTYNI